MGTATGTVRISTYAMPPNTPVTTALVEGLAGGTALTTTAGLVGLATFQIAVLPQSDGPTQFTGKILDHTGKPLQGVRVTVSRTPLSVTTDATGNFSFLQDVPQGKLDLFVDGRAVTGTTPLPGGQTTPTQYPSLHFEVLAIRGQKNILPHPIYLPPLLMSQAKIVGGNEDVSLTIPGRDGFEMIVKANSVTFPDGTRIGPLVVSPVADDRLPMSPPGGAASFMPGAAATIQPSGTRFDPPIEVRLPNTSGYAPGERVVIYHWDHDIGQYVAMGQATVTDDGAQLITDPGSGITKAGWHGPPVPPIPPNCAKDDGPTATQCGEKCESLGQTGVTCPRPMCMADKNFTREQYSCCGGNKYDKQEQCCVDRPPGAIPGKYATPRIGHSLEFLRLSCVNRRQARDIGPHPDPVCRGNISPEGETITHETALGDPKNRPHCIDGCSQAYVLATIFPIVGLGPVVDTQNPTGIGDRYGNGAVSSSFYPACKGHDKCYQTCSKEDKSDCDSTMYDTMKAACNNVPLDLFIEKEIFGTPRSVVRINAKSQCERNAYAYYSGLVLLAGGAFADRKAQYCDCCSVPE